jgi:hypothetical protein
METIDLENKLRGFPHVYYFNLDQKTDRKKYMETQFDRWGIEYTRMSSNIYSIWNYDDWTTNKVTGDKSDTDQRLYAPAMMHFELFKRWLHDTDEEYILVMEDDYDLSLIEYWHFDWNYLMSKLPYDWDCIQLGFETSNVISFYLHPVKEDYSFGPCLFKREYVEKLLRLHSEGFKYRFDFNISNCHWRDRRNYKNAAGSLEYFMCQSGRTYSIPLIALNPYFSFWYYKDKWIPKSYFQMCYDSYYDWWQNDRDKFTLDDFFTYGKVNDKIMERNLEYCDTKYFEEKTKVCREKFLKEYGFK